MILQHKTIFLTLLLLQSFLCIGMKNSDLELMIQDMRAYGADIQKDCIAFGQKTNSSFDRLKPAKKQNICPQNAIVIEQPKRFKTSTEQEEEIIDIATFFQEEKTTPVKTFDPTEHFNDQELEIFYLLSAYASRNKEDYVSYGIKYIEHKEKMLEQKARTRIDTTPKEQALKKIEKNSAPYDPAQRDLNELQKKLQNKHKLESNKNYYEWLKEEGNKLKNSFENITPPSYYNNYSLCPPYMNDIDEKDFYLFKALISEREDDYTLYGHAYANHCEKMIKKQQNKLLNELLQKPKRRKESGASSSNNKSILANEPKKTSIEQLSDEPDIFNNCCMCIAGTTFWAGVSCGIGTLLKVLSQVK